MSWGFGKTLGSYYKYLKSEKHLGILNTDDSVKKYRAINEAFFSNMRRVPFTKSENDSEL